MKHLKLSIVVLLMVFFVDPSHMIGQERSIKDSVFIKPNNSKIQIYGSNYIKEIDGELVIHRHSDKVYKGTTQQNLFNPKKAKANSGIVMKFKTNSSKITVHFRIIEGFQWGVIFNSYQNGIFTKKHTIKYEEGRKISFDLNSKSSGAEVEYSLTFPIKVDVHFLGLELENSSDLIQFEREEKPVYVAFGDSISQGQGQKATPETFPYLIAEAMGFELFNLAVGGGKTSPVMAEMIRDDFEKVDVMTLLSGFNDYNGEGVTVETYEKRYAEVLKTIREKHPNTKLFCITMTYTTQLVSKKTGVPVDDFRNAVRKIVKTRQASGDTNIFLIDGERITSTVDLADKVHLSVKGAENLAKAICLEMEKVLALTK